MHRVIYRIRQSPPPTRTIGAASRTSFNWAHDRSYAIISFDLLPSTPGTNLFSTRPLNLALSPSASSKGRYQYSTNAQQALNIPAIPIPQQQQHLSSSSNSSIPSTPILVSSSKLASSPSPQKLPRKKTVYDWTPELDAMIVAMNQTHSIDWRTIGKLLDRPYTTCYSRYINTIKPILEKGGTLEEIRDREKLERLVEEGLNLIRERKEASAAALAAAAEAVGTSVSKKIRSVGSGTGARAGAGLSAALSSDDEEELGANTSKRPKWDATIDQTIKDMVAAGNSWPEIGRAVGRPFSSCYSRYHANLDPALGTTWSSESIQRLKELALQGVSWKKIAQELKIKSLICKAKWADIGRSELATAAGYDNDSIFTSDQDGQLKHSTPGAALDPSGRKSSTSSRTKIVVFSMDESALILELAERHGAENWDKILQDFQQHFLDDITSLPTTTKPSKGKGKKSPRDRILSITIPHLRKQYLRVSRNKSFWTFDQETALIQQVLKYGINNSNSNDNIDDHWAEIARQTGPHSPEECRTHWKNLDMPVMPNLNAWTKTEQGTFWSAWRQFGSDFKRISKFCSNRTAEDCQRYFEGITKGFPSPDLEPDAFAERIAELQENLPYTRQKYLFTKERSQRLQRTMRICHQRFGASPTMHAGTWQWIANKVHRGLSPTSCIEHWNYLRQNLDVIHGPLEENQTTPIKPAAPYSWSHEESKLLDQGIRELGASWSDIQHRFLPWRTTRSIRQRWFIMSDKATKVTEDEYYTILAAGPTADSIDYEQLTQHHLPGWNLSPCRRVFETSFKHIVKNTIWQPDEDRLLLKRTIEERGRDWNAIAKSFKGTQPAMAPLYDQAMQREKEENGGKESLEPVRTQKTAWQCRLRWCQLVEPLMPKGPIVNVTEHGRSNILRISKKLLQTPSSPSTPSE
ncbi:hypothetical protein BKA57DRAFT_474944 [Linnemannia elongata]|nr:hypothetical protein BKA57DRAFT_474944 [Linnemannia elongata]